MLNFFFTRLDWVKANKIYIKQIWLNKDLILIPKNFPWLLKKMHWNAGLPKLKFSQAKGAPQYHSTGWNWSPFPRLYTCQVSRGVYEIQCKGLSDVTSTSSFLQVQANIRHFGRRTWKRKPYICTASLRHSFHSVRIDSCSLSQLSLSVSYTAFFRVFQ